MEMNSVEFNPVRVRRPSSVREAVRGAAAAAALSIPLDNMAARDPTRWISPRRTLYGDEPGIFLLC